MNYPTATVFLKDGSRCTIRRAAVSDAEALIRHLKVTAEETTFLLKEPEEITLTVPEEKKFIMDRENDPASLMLVAEDEEGICGLCSLMPAGPYARVAHRCTVSIALLQRATGKALGRKMMEALLSAAHSYGYTQAELEVLEDNDMAIRLYSRLGFLPYGTRPAAMKYKDGSTKSEILMYKLL